MYCRAPSPLPPPTVCVCARAQFIFYMEWGHRNLGRLVGAAFAVPALYFAARGQLPRALWPRLAVMFALGGAQGAIGWWMVRSGLETELLHNPSQPRVSPYRLVTHVRCAGEDSCCPLCTTL